MTVKSVMAALAVLSGSILFAADPMDSQDTVEQGKWCNDFPAALEYAEANNVPMLVMWTNPECGHCEKLEAACKKSDFLTWQADRKLVMVFAYGKTTAKTKAAYTWIRNVEKLQYFPFVGVYWPSNADGQMVRAVFTGRSGMMPVTKGTLQEQLMQSVDLLTEGWDPSTPSPTPDPPTPASSYTVAFSIDATKATWSGTLVQTVAAGGSAVAPKVTPKEGWAFAGWDQAFTNVTADLAVAAKFTAVPTEKDVRSEAYGKSQKLTAMVTDSTLGAYVGTATVSLGKISKTGTVKVTAKIALFSGKSYSASKTVTVAKNGGAADTFTFKSPVGLMHFEMGYDATAKTVAFAAEGDGWAIAMVDGTIGGKLDATKLLFSADVVVKAPEDYAFVAEVPSEEPIYVANGTKWTFDKAPTLKYSKDKLTRLYVLVGTDDAAKPNVSGLKLSYKYSTGIFSGSFKMYASNEKSVAAGKKPTLKKYTATVKGVMVDGVGYGIVIVKIGSKVSYTGTCSIACE